MMQRLFRILIFVIVLPAIVLQQSAVAAAATPDEKKQDKSALAVSPAIVEHILKPGIEKKYELRVTNLTNFPLPISGSVRNFVALEDVVDPNKRKLYDASKWFTISEPDFI